MDEYAKKIYNMMYMPIVTPYNLLENAKIGNYKYVKYYNSEEGLIAEMKCEVPEEGEKVFYYHFDVKDYLQKISMECNGINEIVFDRNSAIEEVTLEYYEGKIEFKNVV